MFPLLSVPPHEEPLPSSLPFSPLHPPSAYLVPTGLSTYSATEARIGSLFRGNDPKAGRQQIQGETPPVVGDQHTKS